MQSSSASLFRSEVAISRSERLFGEVTVMVPASWQTIGFLLFFALVTAICFAATANYARVEISAGVVVPTAGVVPIIPQRMGVVAGIAVLEGQNVQAGQPVAFIRMEEGTIVGGSVGQQIEQAIGRQDTTVLAQLRASELSAAAGQQQFSAQRAGLEAEVAQIGAQIASQQVLIANARRAYDQAELIAARGFISQRDLEARQDAVVGREQAMAQLSQMLAAKRSQLAEIKRAAEQSRFQSGAQIAALESSRAQIAQQAAAARGNRAYAIVAPVSGRITALTARVGQPATTQVPLMTVVPASSRLRAELAVPSAAIGFVKPQQEVRLAIDAFPFQRFGTVRGHVSAVASSPVTQPGVSGVAVPLYPVLVELEATSVTAYGHKEPLVPGMTLSARIVTQRQSLLRWLFDPLFAVSRR